MLQGQEPLTSQDFSKGLVTRSDIIRNDPNQSPNTMDVKWNFDSSIQKRLGSSTTNSVTLAVATTANAGWTIDSTGTLTAALTAYWKLDEASGARSDQVGSNTLNDYNGVLSIVGIRNQAALFVQAQTQNLYMDSNPAFLGSGNFSVAGWVYFNSTGGTPADTAVQTVFSKRTASQGSKNWEYELALSSNGIISWRVTANGSGFTTGIVNANSIGAVNTATWYNFVAWHSNGSHIGISVNLSANTAPYTTSITNGNAQFVVGGVGTANVERFLDARVDELGFWGKVLSLGERQNLYGGGTGNTYNNSAAGSPVGWAMFDFGASSIRWLTVACGTGLYASSNRGTTFVAIATSRTQSYQYFERSKNVLIATADAYDVPLYWAGSATTFASTLAPNSAPSAKFSINYQGFLILLNFQNSNGTIRRRGFAYADENLQLTDTWVNGFDFPSSADDEVTAAFILSKFLYVSTRYRIFRVAFVGGNPDWSYLKIKDWGFVPRTVKLVTLKGGQVAVGLDWQRRLRVFDGFDDIIISDNVENNNNYSDFAMKKISFAGSGLVISNAEVDTLEQEYRLNVAIGAMSNQTTHSIVLNARTQALYPYSNQGFQAMCMAESNNQQALMAIDRSGFVHILNSGNMDAYKIPINEVYDSPIMYKESPQAVSKSHEIDMYFARDSAGTVYYRDRVDLSSQFNALRPLKELLGTESSLLVLRTLDLPGTYNTFQWGLTSSSGTANPWKMSRYDLLQAPKGMGRGVNG